MDREQILDLYEWQPGVCFRHPDKGKVPTAHVKTIRLRTGGEEDVRACQDCVMAIERERWVAAGHVGVDYRPGHVGEELA